MIILRGNDHEKLFHTDENDFSGSSICQLKAKY
jgi:hypothetical protein